MSRRKKLFAAVLALIVSFSVIAIPYYPNEKVSAKDTNSASVVAEGTLQNNTGTWKFYDNGVLSLGGKQILQSAGVGSIPGEIREKATTLTYGNEVRELRMTGYSGLDNISSIIIPNGITKIGYEAFNGLSAETITIPESVTYLDSCAFMELHGLKRAVLNCKRVDSLSQFGLETIVFGPNVSYIGASAFINSTLLHTVIFLGDCDYSTSTFAGSESIYIYRKCSGGLAFEEYVGGYKRLTIPSSADGMTVTKIGPYAFEGSNRLLSISLPSTIKSIDKYAFYGCSRLENISLPDGLGSIGAFAFYGCNSLTTLTIPTSVASIGEYAFQNCFALKTVNVGENQKSVADLFIDSAYAASAKKAKINAGAFKGCKRLKTVTIGKNVTKIGAKAFYNCKKLKTIKIKTKKLKKSTIGKNAFKGIHKKATIKVPKKKYKAYKKILKKKGIGKKVKIKKI